MASPRLLFFSSASSGRGRRVEGFLAQVFQRRHNHSTFKLVHVEVDNRPDLAAQFRVVDLPTLLVVEDNKVVLRIVQPRGARELEEKLGRWLA